MTSIRKSPARLFVISFLVLGLAICLALNTGAVSEASAEIITSLRLPRAILAAGVGMGLAVAGVTLQALFANPLCEPYTLGISSGAALGAVLSASLGFGGQMAGLTLTALLGALLFAGLIFLLSKMAAVTALALLLSGVMLQYLGSSLVALTLALSDAGQVQSAMNWLMGDLTRARMNGSCIIACGVLLLVVLVWLKWRELDALLLGELEARAVGVDVDSIRHHLILLSSLMVGLCVSGAGMIGFVGLIVPHFARRFVGSLHFVLIPLCALWGATMMIGADCLARLVARPLELPTGVITALIGAPFFLILLWGRARVLRA